ncbi:MAG: DNRLRE domain-containing protein, partial [Bacteroidales bacterium]|nr:DNRLRE domain-containing protein [Bacteroidales bacterium]
MKHIICFILLLYEGFSLFSQTQTIIFKPDSIDGYDATIHNVVAPNHLNEMYCIYAQPSGYYYAYARALIKFQQINTQIPTNAIILNARLRLFGVDSYWGYGWGNSCYPGYNYPYYANASWIEKITQSWSRTGVNWYNQPATTTENHIEIPNSATQWNWNFADSSQSLVNMVQSWVSTPASNYGFMIKLQSETADKALHFATSYYPNELYRPELEITYTVEPCDIAAELPPEINVCEGDTIKLWNLVADSGSCQWSYMNADGNWANSTDDTLIFVANYSQTVGLIFSKHVYCDTMVSVNINVQPLPAIVFIGDDAVCLGSSITLTATTDTEGCDFLWNTGETSSAITVSPNVPTTYRV